MRHHWLDNDVWVLKKTKELIEQPPNFYSDCGLKLKERSSVGRYRNAKEVQTNVSIQSVILPFLVSSYISFLDISFQFLKIIFVFWIYSLFLYFKIVSCLLRIKFCFLKVMFFHFFLGGGVFVVIVVVIFKMFLCLGICTSGPPHVLVLHHKTVFSTEGDICIGKFKKKINEIMHFCSFLAS